MNARDIAQVPARCSRRSASAGARPCASCGDRVFSPLTPRGDHPGSAAPAPADAGWRTGRLLAPLSQCRAPQHRALHRRPTGGAAAMTGLAEHTKRICRHLLGKPNEHLSTKEQWRYGSKGSLAIEVAGEAAGTWFDHETKTGGGMLDLISREKGFTTARRSPGSMRSLGSVTMPEAALQGHRDVDLSRSSRRAGLPRGAPRLRGEAQEDPPGAIRPGDRELHLRQGLHAGRPVSSLIA